MFAAAVMAVSASAQTTQESKFFDNWYLGVNVGAATKTTHNAWFKNVNPSQRRCRSCHAQTGGCTARRGSCAR